MSVLDPTQVSPPEDPRIWPLNCVVAFLLPVVKVAVPSWTVVVEVDEASDPIAWAKLLRSSVVFVPFKT